MEGIRLRHTCTFFSHSLRREIDIVALKEVKVGSLRVSPAY